MDWRKELRDWEGACEGVTTGEGPPILGVEEEGWNGEGESKEYGDVSLERSGVGEEDCGDTISYDVSICVTKHGYGRTRL